MKKLLGDITKMRGRFDVIVHGCNCFHTMDTGVAKAIRESFPEAYEADLNTKYGDREKMGTISTVEYEDGFCVANAYTQYDYKKSKGDKPLDIKSLREAMSLIRKEFHGKRIGIPFIGADLAGGKWSDIKKVILEELSGEDVTVVFFDEKTFYEDLVQDSLAFHSKQLQSYHRGAHSLMGLFTAKAMKDSDGTADSAKLQKAMQDYIKRTK